MAHEPLYLPFLLGIGVRRISVDPRHLSTVQASIEQIDVADARAHAMRLLRCATSAGLKPCWVQAARKKRLLRSNYRPITTRNRCIRGETEYLLLGELIETQFFARPPGLCC
jgi:hypothetical protein